MADELAVTQTIPTEAQKHFRKINAKAINRALFIFPLALAKRIRQEINDKGRSLPSILSWNGNTHNNIIKETNSNNKKTTSGVEMVMVSISQRHKNQRQKSLRLLFRCFASFFFFHSAIHTYMKYIYFV